MQSGLFRALFSISFIFALSACSKDDSGNKTLQVPLFNGKPLITQADDFSVKGSDAVPTGLASNGDKVLWACGNILTPSVATRAIVRQTNTSGDQNEWSIVSETDGPTHEGATNSAIAADRNGNVYVAQTLTVNKLGVASILYFTAKDGWKSVNYETPNLSSSLNSVTVSPSGVPYFTGVTEDGSHKKGFILTLINDQPQLMTTSVDKEFRQVSVKVNGDYSVVGTDLTETAPSWFLGSANFEAVTVSTADSSRELSSPNLLKAPDSILGTGTAVMMMTIKENNGRRNYTYVGGVTSDATGWSIKRSADGVKFTDEDNFINRFSKVNLGGLFNYKELPFAFGGGTDANGHSHWIIRYAEITGKWKTLLRFNQSHEVNLSAQVVGIAAITGGNRLAILGKSHDAATGYHWRMMKISEHGFSTVR
jgi:hypothetical protein